jgi:hypothetical protein
MDKDKQIQKVQKYVVEKIVKRDNLLIRGLRELGLLTSTLKLISSGDVIIGALDGSRFFKFSDGDLFKFVFFDLAGLNTEENAIRSNEAELLVYEQVKDSTINQMFLSLNRNIDELCLTQNQILEFLDNYKKYSMNKTNHFLFKSNDRVFIAQVCADSDDSMRLFGGLFSMNDDSPVYPVKDVHFRVIVPK